MRCGVLWFAACLLTATRGQFLISQLLDEAPETSKEIVDTFYSPVDRNEKLNRDESISNNSTPALDLYSDASLDSSITVLDVSVNNTSEGNTIESSRNREGESHPANESNETSEIVSTENTFQINSTSEEADSAQHPQSVEAQNKDNVSAESTESGEKLSNEKQESNDVPDIPDSGASVGQRSNESEQEGNESIASKEETTDLCEYCEMVQTTHGPVKGHKWPGSDDIISFIDIPYGKVDGPFEAPHTAQSWIDVHDVTEHKKQCPQHQSDRFVGDIDCLTLSIFKPTAANNASVLFYVHDHNFGSGDPSIYGPEYLVHQGIILVLPNYRFGALGFLCLHNETARGNAGLKDLSLALEWVRNNIHAFGGNPSNIAVGGDGHSGALVGYLALCSRSRYYISKVIIESGSMLSHLAIDRSPENTAKTLADNIRINYSNHTLYNNTFEEVTVEAIVDAAKGMRFNPCIERDKEPFMEVTPWTLLHNEEIDITFMIGSAIYAGAHDAVATTESLIEKLNADLELILPNDLTFENGKQKTEHALRVKTQYFGEDAITPSQVEELSRLFTDASYLSPTVRSARWKPGLRFICAVRSDIIGYLFTQGGNLPVENSTEKMMINQMVELWVSFMNTGIPTAGNVEWNKLKRTEDTDEEFLLINATLTPSRGLHMDRLRLWTELYDEHFIERSGTIALTSGYHPFITIMLLLSYTKFHDDH